MNVVSPAEDHLFTISTAAIWPSIPFETDATGPHTWTWTITWKSFSTSGTVITSSNAWDARNVITGFGGTLTVSVKAGTASAGRIVRINGANPTPADTSLYLAACPGSDGFEKILQQESHLHHFALSGDPIMSLDEGYGMCQLTTPAPTFQEIWNWQANLQAGLALFASKRAASIAYLTQDGRTATEVQIRYESVCRWNGGPYHVWNQHQGWARNANILCDVATGNMGWDLRDSRNTGKTAAVLHHRDAPNYNRLHRPDDPWQYFGVCYADKVLA